MDNLFEVLKKRHWLAAPAALLVVAQLWGMPVQNLVVKGGLVSYIELGLLAFCLVMLYADRMSVKKGLYGDTERSAKILRQCGLLVLMSAAIVIWDLSLILSDFDQVIDRLIRICFAVVAVNAFKTWGERGRMIYKKTAPAFISEKIAEGTYAFTTESRDAWEEAQSRCRRINLAGAVLMSVLLMFLSGTVMIVGGLIAWAAAIFGNFQGRAVLVEETPTLPDETTESEEETTEEEIKEEIKEETEAETEETEKTEETDNTDQ